MKGKRSSLRQKCASMKNSSVSLRRLEDKLRLRKKDSGKRQKRRRNCSKFNKTRMLKRRED